MLDDDELAMQTNETYGLLSHLDIVSEELSGLIYAIQIWKRMPSNNDKNIENLARGIAGAELVLNQLIWMMDQGECCGKGIFMPHLEGYRSAKRSQFCDRIKYIPFLP